MERNSPGALRAPDAFGARGTLDHHVTLSSCSLYITRVCSLAAVLRPSRCCGLRPQHPSAAAPLTTRPPAAPAPLAPLPLFSACESVAILRQAMRVCSLAAVLRPLAAPPAPLSAAFGRTSVLPSPASLAGDDASAALLYP
jgi:hypothetical protein